MKGWGIGTIAGAFSTNMTPRWGVSRITAVCLVMLAVFLYSSCKKSSDSSKSKTTYLTQSTWKVQSVGVDVNKDGTSDADASGYLQACQLDNVYTFKSDGNGTIDEGATKCNSTDPQTSSFTWTLKNNDTILSGNFGLTNGDATIITMDDNNFVFSTDQAVGSPPTTYRLIITLKH